MHAQSYRNFLCANMPIKRVSNIPENYVVILHFQYMYCFFKRPFQLCNVAIIELT
jgi:hypothetical protein